MSAKSNVALPPSATELVITRVFAAPRVLVWDAWTKSEHLMRWSCPKNFTVLFSDGDLRVGGAWRTGMRSPGGEKFVMHGEYREIDEPQKLVFTHSWEDDELHDNRETLVTVELEEVVGGTKMTFTQTNFATASSRDGHAGGWNGAFENLDAYLQSRN